MASSIFPCYSSKADKKYKKRSISQPLNVSPPTLSPARFEASRSPMWTVIMAAKYDFQASARPEISVRKGDHVRLLERPGNGWLKVQLIQEIGEGLVPAQYLEIALNDPAMPVSSEWLNDFQAHTTMRNRVVSMNVKGAYISPSNNYWYRVDAVFSSGRTTVCALFHEDFVSLEAYVHAIEFADEQKVSLPPKSYAVSPDKRDVPPGEKAAPSQAQVVMSLDSCLQIWVRMARQYSSNFLGEYVEDHCTRKIYLREGETGPSNDAVATLLVEGSVPVPVPRGPIRNCPFSPTAPLPPVPGSPADKISHRAKGSPRGSASTPVSPSTPFEIAASPSAASNMKYSSYLNQSRSSITNCLRGMKPSKTKHVRPISMMTTASLNSLLDQYAISSSEDSDVEQEVESSHHFQERADISLHMSGIKPLRQVSQDGAATHRNTSFKSQPGSGTNSTQTFSTHYSTDYNSTLVSSPDHLHEPRTPTFAVPLFHPSINNLDALDTSPLEPRKHHSSFPPVSGCEVVSPLSRFQWDPLSDL